MSTVLTKQLFQKVTLEAGGSLDSSIFDMTTREGECRLQYEVTRDGVVKVEAVETINGADFPDLPVELATGLTKTSGDGNGKGFIDLGGDTEPVIRLCKSSIFRITETGGVSAAGVDLWIAAR
jgi:hypothetical protein